MKSNKGFTLVELLVVVLIIGILAAIAVPQYRLAVEKSRLAQVISAVKSITEAQEVYYLTNGKYTNKINDLDINVALPKGWSINLVTNADTNKVEIFHDRRGLISYYQNCAKYCLFPGQIYCFAWSDDSFGKKLCRSIGTKEEDAGDNNVRVII